MTFNASVELAKLLDVVGRSAETVVEVLAADGAGGSVDDREDVVEVEVVPRSGVDATASEEAVVDGN